MAKQCSGCNNTIGFMSGYMNVPDTDEIICPNCYHTISDLIEKTRAANNLDVIASIKTNAEETIKSNPKIVNPQALLAFIEYEYEKRKEAIELAAELEQSRTNESSSNNEPLSEAELQMQKTKDDFIAVTSNNIEGYRITKYHGIATGTAVMGKGAFTGTTDFGGENTRLSKKMEEVKNQAMEYAIENAISMGGNALIAAKVDLNTITTPGGVIGPSSVNIAVMVSGTSVTIEKCE